MGLELVTGYRGTLHITAPQDADLYRGLFGDGRVNVGNLMDVSVTAPLEVTVLDGVCLLDGREFFVANGDSVAVECAVETGTAYLCICYEKDESSLHETADFQILESYNDIDIRTGPSASQKPYAKLTVENGTITNVEMLVDTAEPIIDISREAGETLDKVDGALENVDDTLDKMNEYFESLSVLTERTEKAAEDAEDAAQTGIKSTEISYQGGDSGTTPPEGEWTKDIPHVEGGHYLWTRVLITYNDDSENTFYSVSKMGSETGVDITYNDETKTLIITT